MAMIGPIKCHDSLRLRMLASKPQREIIRLAAATDKSRHCQALRQRRRQCFGVRNDCIVQIARIRIEYPRLPRQYFHDFTVGMTEMRHIIVAIEIGAPAIIIEKYALPTHDLHWSLVGNAEIAE